MSLIDDDAIKDAYGGEDNNPSAIYMALIFDTDVLDPLRAKYGESVMHDRGFGNLALANRWDDPRVDVTGKLGELLGLIMAVGADADPRVSTIIEIARRELRARS